MAFFFSNPILSKLEDLLWQKAKKRYVDEGGDPFKDLSDLPKDAQAKVKGWVATWQSEERKKLAVALPEYKRIIEERVATALRACIGASHAEWYSIEVKDSIYPIVLAVPTAVIRLKTRARLPALLAEKIQFQDLTAESLAALADQAIESHFRSVLGSFMKKMVALEIQKAFRPAIIVAELENDFYHFDNQPEVARENMLILHSFVENSESPEKPKKAAQREWRERHAQPNGRPDDRRFAAGPWGLLPQSQSFQL